MKKLLIELGFYHKVDFHGNILNKPALSCNGESTNVTPYDMRAYEEANMQAYLPKWTEFVGPSRGVGLELLSPEEVYKQRDIRNMQYYVLVTQKTELYMFAPVGEDGEILHDPMFHASNGRTKEEGMKNHDKKMKQYQDALDKVLFECKVKTITGRFVRIELPSGTCYSFSVNGGAKNLIHRPPETIEGIILAGETLVLK